MSGDIRDMEKINSRKLETLNRQNSREIKNLEANHDAIKTQTKENLRGDLVELQSEHVSAMERETSKKEKVLAEMKSHLNHTKEMTEKQLRDLAKSSTEDKSALHNKHVEDRQRMVLENQTAMEEMNDQFNSQTQKVNRDGKSRIEGMKEHVHGEYEQTALTNDQKLSNLNHDFAHKFQTTDSLNKKVKADQDDKFKKERMTSFKNQSTELEKTTDIHHKTLKAKDQDFKKGLHAQGVLHEDQFGKAVGKQNSEYKKLEDTHKKLVEKFKSDMAVEIEKKVSRGDDPFFQFIELRPTLKETPEGVEIQVKIPEHSKQDVGITTNNKDVTINFNRRYTDANTNEQGVVSRVNKVESLTSKLSTSHVLDGKSLKSNYENGVMTYTIKRA